MLLILFNVLPLREGDTGVSMVTVGRGGAPRLLFLRVLPLCPTELRGRRIDIVAGDFVKDDPVAVAPGRRLELDFGRRIEANTPLPPAAPVRALVVAAAAAMLPPDPEFFLSRVMEPPDIFLSRGMVLDPPEVFLSRVMVLEPVEVFRSRVRVELEPGRIFLANRSPLLTLLIDFRPDAWPGA